MRPPDDVEADVVETERHRMRGVLVGVGAAIAAGLFVLLAPSPAHADDGTGGLVGGALDGLTGVMGDVVAPVVEPLPEVRELPVVGHTVGHLADAAPLGSLTRPVAGVVDGLLGDSVGSLPVVGGVLGDRPVGGIIDPIAGTVDDTLGGLAGAPSEAAPGAVPGVNADAASADTVLAAANALRMAVLAPALLASEAAQLGAGLASVPAWPPLTGLAGDLAPASAVSASGGSGAFAAALFGSLLLFLLVARRLPPELLRAPSAPTFDTDSSPD